MQLSLIDIFLSDGAARAVCWTLVHSLWEGVLAAALAGLIILCTRKLPAAVRYNLLAADLLLFLLVAGGTVCYEFRQGNRLLTPGTALVTDGGGGAITQLWQKISFTAERHGSLIQRTGDYLNTHAAVVTLVWLACLLGQILRLTGGVYHIHRLRRNSVVPPGEFWPVRLQALARRLGIKRTITLLQSGLIKTPAAFGFIKPCILVPLGMLASLPPDQVETILLHELAHIHRNDYIANLLLHLTEAIFFFNPGVRWVATLIRREREACCDDMVLAGTPDRNSYFEALIAFTSFATDRQTAHGPSYALQLGGTKTDLLWRIRRMLDQENKKLQVMEKAILSFGLMALVSVSLISMKEKERPVTTKSAAVHVAQAPARHIQQDTVRITTLTTHSDTDDGSKRSYAVATDDNGNRYEIRKLNGEVIEFKVNGKLIAKEDYGRYTDIFDEVKALQTRPKEPVPPRAPVSPREPVGLVGRVGPVRPVRPLRPEAPLRPESPVRSIEPVQPVQPVKPLQREEPPTLANPLVFTNNPDPTIKMIAADLVDNRLIDHVDQLSFALDADGLTVNGAKQSQDVYLKFREKYIRRSGDHFIYSQYYTPHGSGSRGEVTRNEGELLSDHQ
jgi:bla regulator protein blaR1